MGNVEYEEFCKSRIQDILGEINIGKKTPENYYKIFQLYQTIFYESGKDKQYVEEYAQLATQTALMYIEKNNNASESYRILAEISNYRNDKQKMFEYINRAIELEPNNAEYYLIRGEYCEKSGLKTNAKEDYDKACRLNPEYKKTVEEKHDFYKTLNKAKILGYILIVLIIGDIVISLYKFLKNIIYP